MRSFARTLMVLPSAFGNGGFVCGCGSVVSEGAVSTPLAVGPGGRAVRVAMGEREGGTMGRGVLGRLPGSATALRMDNCTYGSVCVLRPSPLAAALGRLRRAPPPFFLAQLSLKLSPEALAGWRRRAAEAGQPCRPS